MVTLPNETNFCFDYSKTTRFLISCTQWKYPPVNFDIGQNALICCGAMLYVCQGTCEFETFLWPLTHSLNRVIWNCRNYFQRAHVENVFKSFMHGLRNAFISYKLIQVIFAQNTTSKNLVRRKITTKFIIYFTWILS